MNLVQAIIAESEKLPPITAFGYEYVLAANGLFIRAEDSRMEALVPIAPAHLHGLAELQPYARLKIPRLSEKWLHSVLCDAHARLPNEVLYQFSYRCDGWHCARPPQKTNPTAVTFADAGEAVVDLHSHNTMAAFFSETDDADEQGLRFYVVIGHLDTEVPVIALRVGVYGHRLTVSLTTVFDGPGPFTQVVRTCRVCGCTDEHACEGGCSWVESDLCSQCQESA